MHTIIQKSHSCLCKNAVKSFRNLSISSAKRKGSTTSRLRFEKLKENRPIAPGEYALLVSTYQKLVNDEICAINNSLSIGNKIIL